LVEDDFILRGALVELLRGEGYLVECAANGIDALGRLARDPQPSLILLDIMLPHMDGIEFRAAQRSSPAIADIPVIVISAVGLSRQEANDLDLHQSFVKPLDTKKLLAAIKNASRPLAM
jgi:CheY-like chemotaxis protein